MSGRPTPAAAKSGASWPVTGSPGTPPSATKTAPETSAETAIAARLKARRIGGVRVFPVSSVVMMLNTTIKAAGRGPKVAME